MPIGAVWRSYPEQERMVLYPALIGSDIGCGMSLWKLAADAASFRSAKAARRLAGLYDPVATACFPDNVAIYACGHIHNFQHIQKKGDNIDYVVEKDYHPVGPDLPMSKLVSEISRSNNNFLPVLWDYYPVACLVAATV